MKETRYQKFEPGQILFFSLEELLYEQISLIKSLKTGISLNDARVNNLD